MKKITFILAVCSLIICPLSLTAKKNLTESEEVVLTFKEAAYYLKALLTFHAALKIFNQSKDANTPEISCKFCPKRSLPCDKLIVKIQAKAMDKAIGEKDCVADAARKKMLSIYHEITQLLCNGSLDDIRKLMAKIAQEEQIPCEECQKIEWRAIGVSKSAT